METEEMKKFLKSTLQAGFKCCVEMESAINRHESVAVVVTACAWILAKCKRTWKGENKKEFLERFAYLMSLCEETLELYEKQEGGKHGEDE